MKMSLIEIRDIMRRCEGVKKAIGNANIQLKIYE